MLAIILLCLINVIWSQEGMPDGFGKDINAKAAYVKEDVKFIRCQACQFVAKQAYRQVKEKRASLGNPDKLKEFDIIEMIEKISNPDTDEGEWITMVDIQEEGDKLVLREMRDYSECKSECRTIAKACEKILEDTDTDLAEELWKGEMNRAKISNYLCYDLTDACTKPTPKVPKSRKPGEQFIPLTQEEREMQKQLAKMKGSGMKGQLFDRNAAEQYLEQMQEFYNMDYSGDYDGGDFGMGDSEENPLGVLDSVMGHVNKGIEVVKKHSTDAYGKASKWISDTYKTFKEPKKTEL